MTDYPFSFTIVMAADSGYAHLLKGLVQSLRALPEGKEAKLCLLDLGLNEEDREGIAGEFEEIVKPDWDISFDGQETKPGWFKAMVSRPFVPKHFPGYDVYLWIDADAWVQTWEAPDIYLKTAWRGKMAVTPEIDRCYKSHNKWQRPRWRTLTFKEFQKGYGWKTANKLGRFNVINSGVFALRGDAPHWDRWADSLTTALKKTDSTLVEQTALNHAIYSYDLPVGLLPAWCNWVCVDAPPMLDEQVGMFVEPEPPHHPLSILHLLGPVKNTVFDIETTEGKTVSRMLHYEA